MKTSFIGKKAEAAVSGALKRRGYELVANNWRTKVCEIDIVAKKGRIIYFVEVKYRSKIYQGDGFDYITPTKLKQMKYAAAIWAANHNWEGDYRLMAASVYGEDFKKIDIIEI